MGRDSLDLTSRALTGKRKKKKSSTRKLAERNNRAIEALVAQLDKYIKQDREKQSSGKAA
ncbi:hypothetical protein ABZ791_37980 [Streptomyces huasconensis]|uniref:Uncharacterized protein n=1 Tax=Streptomyces huasconensis TaxID=1854574 RepID=A0ABV3M907_9ACTN